MANFTAGHSQLAKTAIEAGEGILMTPEKETGFCEHIAFSLPQEVFPFDFYRLLLYD